MKHNKLFFVTCLSLFLCLIAFNVPSFSYSIIKDWTLYGNLAQGDITHDPYGNVIDWGPTDGCGPTAAVNSFDYLEIKYPEIYSGKLIADFDLGSTAALLGEDYMNTTLGSGTRFEYFVLGKYQWMEERAPGMTEYEAKYLLPWGITDAKPSWVSDNDIPSFAFILHELEECEDVEILIENGLGNGHYLTVTGLQQAGSGVIMYYIDPLTGQLGYSTLSFAQYQGYNVFKLDYTAGVFTGTAYITAAMSESPLPEPTTMLLLSLGLAGLAGLRRKFSN